MVDVPKFNANVCDQIISEINFIRSNPKAYANKLTNYASKFKGNILKLPNMKNGIVTTEGATPYYEAASFLKSLPKLNLLKGSDALCEAAQDLANQMSELMDFAAMSSIDRQEIINKYGSYSGSFGQSTDFGSLYPEMIVMNLIVDDGDSQRRNRQMMFDDSYNKIGVGIQKHDKFKSVTVIMYATEFQSNISSNTNQFKYSTQREIDGYDPLSKDSGYRKDLNTDTAKYDYNGDVIVVKTHFKDVPNVNYKFDGGIDERKDLITDTAKYGFDEEVYDNPVNIQPEYHNVEVVQGDTFKSSKKNYNNTNVNNTYGNNDMVGVEKIKKNEKIITEGGKKKKVTKITKYMETGEINTEIIKENI